MVNITIDGRKVEVAEGMTILEAAKSVGINLPTLCYLKDYNEIGACRVCLVEIKGIERLAASCNTTVCDGMEILTNSPRVREARKINVQLILSQHDSNCATCVRSGSCQLQSVANDLGIFSLDYKKKIPPNNWPMDFPLIRHESRCIKCMRCIQVCNNMQNIGIWDSINSGSHTTVGVSHGRSIWDSDCSLCGQCITHCPVGALRERDDTNRVFDALADPECVTVVQIAPAVRAAWGESLGLCREKATVNRLISVLRKMGFNYIYDTNFSADLTIMEEGKEFLARLKQRDKYTFPMFTSCCPGWIRYAKSHYPDMLDQISITKSPQQMFGAVTKDYLAEKLGIAPSRIFSISIMPCTAKKAEAALSTMQNNEGVADVDIVLTTREIDRMIRAEHIDPTSLAEEEFDSLMGVSTGAAVIFGATGGVMEAALRSVYYLVEGRNPDADAFENVRGMDGWREAEYTIGGTRIRVAVANGLGNAHKLIEALRRGDVSYDFVEIMACPGGCAGGGGQPITPNEELAGIRGKTLYGLDKSAATRFSHENIDVLNFYKHYNDEHHAKCLHKLLHTDHKAWDIAMSPDLEK